MSKITKSRPINIKNRKAQFEYHIETKFNAGIVLSGSEIKSIRLGNANISEAYCVIENNQIIIKNMHISDFKNAGYAFHEPFGDRTLLLNKLEIKKMVNKLKDGGYTIVPLEIFFSETGYAKIIIALAKGKKNYDKRADIKSKDIQREIERFQ